MTDQQAMRRIDARLAHVWMVRTFLKHSEEAEDDEELCNVHRSLYDAMLSLGDAWHRQDATAYLKQARKKLPRLRSATAQFHKIQPEVSGHTNFRMAAASLETAVSEIVAILDKVS
ncbi:MAG: amidohydrolase [Pirellulales bacterium]